MATRGRKKTGKPRYSGMRPAARAADDVTRRLFGKNGFARTDILTKWPQIVGSALARHSLPERLQFPRGKGGGGTLWVRVDGALGLELQHLEPVLISRINTQCGYQVVAKLRIVQGPLPERAQPPATPSLELDGPQATALKTELASTADPELHAALARLGRGVYSRNRP